MIAAPYHQNRKDIREAGCTECGFIGSVEIPDLTSLPEIHDEPVFDGCRKGGCSPLEKDGGHEKIPKVSSLCRSGGDKLEDFLKEIFSCSFVAARRCPEGHLLQFALPCGNSRKVETIFNSFSNQSSLMATIDSPKNVMKNDDFYRAGSSKDLLFYGSL